MLLDSTNLKDFDQEVIREYKKPMNSIPPHQFLCNAGIKVKHRYMEMLTIEETVSNPIKFQAREVCMLKCLKERCLLKVQATT